VKFFKPLRQWKREIEKTFLFGKAFSGVFTVINLIAGE